MPANSYSMMQFPPRVDLQTVAVLQALAEARALLGELKGRAAALPNPDILLSTLSLQEALASSEIENIVTTQDEAFRTRISKHEGSQEAKEVSRYCDAMYCGYQQWQAQRRMSDDMLIAMFRILKQSSESYREKSVVIANTRTGEVVYTPPKEHSQIVSLMQELVRFINDETASDLNPLVKMALVHHQFESIHPFSDGNGRIGRVLNVLYLTQQGILDSPILYLSRPINHTKQEYYRLLQAVRIDGAWEEWVLYMLNAVVSAAATTLHLVSQIKSLLDEYKHRMRAELRKIYTHELINNLFFHPYTTIGYTAQDLQVDRRTARKHLQKLAEHSFVDEVKFGRNTYFVNRKLVDLLGNIS